jgi:hypothetical protein
MIAGSIRENRRSRDPFAFAEDAYDDFFAFFIDVADFELAARDHIGPAIRITVVKYGLAAREGRRSSNPGEIAQNLLREAICQTFHPAYRCLFAGQIN